MLAKINCLALILWLTTSPEAGAQRATIDSIHRKLATVQNDSLHWYYTLELAAKYVAINFDSARMYGEQSLALSGDRGKGMCKTLSTNTLGGVYWRKGDYETALKYYFEALRLAKAAGLPKLESTSLANIGLIYSSRQDTARAFDYLRKSLTIKFSLRDTLGIMRGLNNLGEALLSAGQPDSALAYFQRCLPWFDYRPDQVFGKGIVLNNIGTILLERNDFAGARNYLEQSRRLREQIGDTGGLSVVLSNLGQLELAQGRPAQAIVYLERSLALSSETGSSSDRSDVLKKLAEAHAAQNQFVPAYQYLQQYVAMLDTLHRQESEERIAEMEVKYQTGLKEAELAQKQLQIERQQSRQRLLLTLALVLALSLLGLFQYFRNRQRLRQKENRYALALQEAEAAKLRELDRVKSSFFANISHEFRTPLTLILGPVQQWLRDPGANTTAPAPGEAREITIPAKDLQTIHRNAGRLLELINQLLDLSKLESGRMQLAVAQGDVNQTLRVLANAFDSMADQGNIDYQIELPAAAAPAWFDRDKLQKIVGNLLANAFKHTAPGGLVRLTAQVRDERLHLAVEDNGQGIPAEALDRIFERFYQVESSGDKGTGIGLALVKELVALHQGQISVDSRVGEGSVFRIELPLKREAFAPEALTNAPPEAVVVDQARFRPEGPAETVAGAVAENSQLPLCLVVEDNRELQHFIREQLEGQFRVLLAANGRDGLALAIETIPDLIISDVMMPEMDGNELCTALKTDERTSHVPVVLLTARAGQESRLAGLETGADDYLTKPFDTRELLVRARNLVDQRERLRRQFTRTVVLKPQEIALTSADERFLQRIQDTLDARLGDEQFSVEELATAVGMSRSQLHRKLTALIDQPPVEFIRNFRLRRAKEMLEAGTGNVSEIGFEVGFASPAYFSKAFKDAFGISPSEVRKKGNE